MNIEEAFKEIEWHTRGFARGEGNLALLKTALYVVKGEHDRLTQELAHYQRGEDRTLAWEIRTFRQLATICGVSLPESDETLAFTTNEYLPRILRSVQELTKQLAEAKQEGRTWCKMLVKTRKKAMGLERALNRSEDYHRLLCYAKQDLSATEIRVRQECAEIARSRKGTVSQFATSAACIRHNNACDEIAAAILHGQQGQKVCEWGRIFQTSNVWRAKCGHTNFYSGIPDGTCKCGLPISVKEVG